MDTNEIHILVDIHNYIDGHGEMGVSATDMLERYEDKAFLQTVLEHLNDAKYVMKTGVCEVTYVHRKHIRPWVVNTYHLKRLDRVSKLISFFPFIFVKAPIFNYILQEAIEPTTKTILQVSDEPSTSSKRPRIEECSNDSDSEAMVIDESAVEPTIPTTSTQDDPTEGQSTDPKSNESKPKPSTRRAKRLAEKSIEHRSGIDANMLPRMRYNIFHKCQTILSFRMCVK